MKKSRYSEEQIIAVLKEQQAGIPVGLGFLFDYELLMKAAD